MFNVPWQSVRIPEANLSKCSLAESTNIHCNCVFWFTQQLLSFSQDANPSTGNKKNGKPGDQNVCLQCGHWSVAQRVDVYAGNRFLYPLENQTWQSKIPYKWWIGGFSISYWTMISTDHEISNAWQQCLICVDGLICFEVANLIWKTLSPNIRRSRRQQREWEFECPCWKCTCFLRYYIIYIITDLGFQMIDLLCLSHTWDEVWDGWTPSTDVFSRIESEASSMPTCWSRLPVPRLAIHEKCADHAWRGQRIKWTLFKWS